MSPLSSTEMGQLLTLPVDKQWKPKPLPWEEPYTWRAVANATRWNGCHVRVLSPGAIEGQIRVKFYGALMPSTGWINETDLAPILEHEPLSCPICKPRSNLISGPLPPHCVKVGVARGSPNVAQTGGDVGRRCPSQGLRTLACLLAGCKRSRRDPDPSSSSLLARQTQPPDRGPVVELAPHARTAYPCSGSQ